MSTTEIRNIELYKNATPLLDTYQIIRPKSTNVGFGKHQCTCVRKQKERCDFSRWQKISSDNKLNSMTGRDWTLSLTLLPTHYPTRGKEGYAMKYENTPTPKPPQLMRISYSFSKEGELIFDYFVGVGEHCYASLCTKSKNRIESTYIKRIIMLQRIRFARF